MQKKTMREVYEEQNKKSVIEKEGYPGKKLGDFEECPEFPRDLTQESYKILGRLHSRYTAFLAFINERIARKKYYVDQLRMRKIRQRAAIVFRSGGTKLKQLSAVQQDTVYLNLAGSLLNKRAEMVALQNIMWSLKSYIDAIKFEVDRRNKGYRANVEDT